MIPDPVVAQELVRYTKWLISEGYLAERLFQYVPGIDHDSTDVQIEELVYYFQEGQDDRN